MTGITRQKSVRDAPSKILASNGNGVLLNALNRKKEKNGPENVFQGREIGCGARI
jgi:hypothetical protein